MCVFGCELVLILVLIELHISPDRAALRTRIGYESYEQTFFCQGLYFKISPRCFWIQKLSGTPLICLSRGTKTKIFLLLQVISLSCIKHTVFVEHVVMAGSLEDVRL